jgi:hypothetical protein
MRKHVASRAITVFLLGLLAALPLHAGEGLPIVRSVDSALLNQAPDTLTFYLYDAPDASEPVRIEHLQADQWQADVDLQAWPSAQERAIRFRAELGGLDAIATGAPLWVEMEVDGVPVGERSVLAQAATGVGGISTAGMVESRSGGFKFPDGSIQTTAASGTGSGGSGTITSITAGSGLSGGTITSTGTISVDPSQTQSRVSGSCPAGSSIRAIAADGTVSCENDDVGSGGSGGGTVTSITAGGGLTGGTITGAGTIGVDTSQIQVRVGDMCPVGSSIRTITAAGSVVCENDDVGATTSDLAAHAASDSAHHSRYADAEAVTAIKAADGTGSSLDADLLDGLHASEVIASAVAQSAVATPIGSLPYTINQSGSYYVTGNLDGSSGGIDITADNVTLDLMGFTLDGGGSVNDFGIKIQSVRKNVTIKNGTVRRFGDTGISQSYNPSYFIKVINVRSLDNGYMAPVYRGDGIKITASNSFVIGCTVGSNAGQGIAVRDAAIVRNNTVYGNGSGAGTTSNGIHAGSGSQITGNTVYGHLEESMFTAAIKVSDGSVVRNNTVYSNQSWGISCSRCLIRDNSVSDNNQVDDSSIGGVWVNQRSLVVGNTVQNNKRNGIVVNSVGNVLRDNHITQSNPGVGIQFLSGSNYYRDNTAYGNGTDFVAIGITDGGGNVGF